MTHTHKGFELLRILSMFFIVCHHYLVHGGILQEQEISGNYILAWGIDAFTYVGVNCFVLLTGYFMIMRTEQKHVELLWNKIGKLWLTLIFYSIGGVIIGAQLDLLTLKSVITAFLPVRFNEYWFISSYVGLIVLSPYLNRFVKTLDKKDYLYFLVVLVALFSFYSCIGDTFHVASGYSLLWFMVLYFVGGYLHRYHISLSNLQALTGYIGISVLIWGCKTAIDWGSLVYLGHLPNKVLYPYVSVYAYNSFTLFVSSLCIFLLFQNFKVHNSYISKGISYFSPLMLGVYLIHENPFFRSFLWSHIIEAQRFYDSPWFFLHFLISTTAVFLSAACIEWGRQRLFQWLARYMPGWIYKLFVSVKVCLLTVILHIMNHILRIDKNAF